jgi:hypothetical protein
VEYGDNGDDVVLTGVNDASGISFLPLKNAQVEEIVAYVRQLQAANGIVWQERRM